VNKIKREHRFTVVVGNPPYSKSMSRHPWSLSLVDDFKEGLKETKSDLTREEWKFLRFGYCRVESASIGIVGYVINNAFIGAPTHRGIRKFLLTHTADLMILDLHGDSRKGETSPDGSSDANVFAIQQGVCVLLGVRALIAGRTSRMRKADLFGTRQLKYERLVASSEGTTALRELQPQSPLFLFRDSAGSESSLYSQWTAVTDVFVNSNTGIQTKNDALFVDTSKEVLCRRMSDVLANISRNRASVCEKYGLKDTAGWRISQLDDIPFDSDAVRDLLYKPFDHRFVYYNTAALGRARHSTMQHMMKPNLALVATRQVTRLPFCHAFVSRWPIEEKTGSHDRTTQLFPLYVYPQARQLELSESRGQDDCRETALSAAFVSKLGEMLGRGIDGARRASDPDLLAPEMIFRYIYAILHSPSYREQFGPELMQDFARVPLTDDAELFCALSNLGGALVAMHLMESPMLDSLTSTYTGPREPQVVRVGWSEDTVWLDAATKGNQGVRRGTIGFGGVTKAIWEFHIGGYQVCEKWLKDRKGQMLSEDDIAHYQKIVVALSETIRLMGEIDQVIQEHGGWPGAFSTA
jgi:predicted helicase